MEIEDGQEWFGIEDVAKAASDRGVKHDSVYTMLSKSRRRTLAGTFRPYDLPLPDRKVLRPVPRRPPFKPVAQWTPQWRRETIDRWLVARADQDTHNEAQARPHDSLGRFTRQEEEAS